MTSTEIHTKINILLDHFNDGQKRYMTDALLNKIINILARHSDGSNVSELLIIDNLLSIIDEQQKEIFRLSQSQITSADRKN